MKAVMSGMNDPLGDLKAMRDRMADLLAETQRAVFDVVLRVAGVDRAVVPFHDLLRRTALVGGEQDLAVRVLVGSEHGARLPRVR